jgi:hypothetical protein
MVRRSGLMSGLNRPKMAVLYWIRRVSGKGWGGVGAGRMRFVQVVQLACRRVQPLPFEFPQGHELVEWRSVQVV